MGLSKPASVTLQAKAVDAVQLLLRGALAAKSFVDQAQATLAMIGKDIDQLLEGLEPDIPLIKQKKIRSEAAHAIYGDGEFARILLYCPGIRY